MKKFLILSLLLISLFIYNTAYSQSFFSLKGGYSMPLGKYASNSLEDGSFAMSGLSFGVDGAWFFYKNIGVGADVSYTLHSVDAVGIATQLVYSDPFLSDMRVRSEPNTMLSTLGGIYYSLTLTERLSIEPKFLAGMMWTKTPFQLYEPEYFMVGPGYYKITSSKDHSFAYKTGLSIKYQLSNCVLVGVHADFTHSSMSFGFYNSQGLYYKNRNYSFLDLGLGLVIKL